MYPKALTCGADIVCVELKDGTAPQGQGRRASQRHGPVRRATTAGSSGPRPSAYSSPCMTASVGTNRPRGASVAARPASRIEQTQRAESASSGRETSQDDLDSDGDAGAIVVCGDHGVVLVGAHDDLLHHEPRLTGV